MSARFALIVASDPVLAWSAACLDDLASIARCELVVHIDDPRRTPAGSGAPRAIFRRVQPASERSTPHALPAADALMCRVRRSDGSVEFDEDDVAGIKVLDLDFALDLSGSSFKGGIVSAARLGIWSFRFGDPLRTCAWRPGAWELLRGEPIVKAALVKAGFPREDVLKEGYFEAVPDDAAATADVVRFAAARWPARVLHESKSGTAVDGVVALDIADPGAAPSRRQELELAAKVSAAYIGRRIASAFKQEHWYPGLVRRPIASFVQTSDYDVEWLFRSAAGHYAADPFGCIVDDATYVFCEEYDYRDKRGYLSAAPLNQGKKFQLRFAPVMRPPHHISYPFVFENDGDWFCVPEASESGQVALFRARNFPLEWDRVAVLLPEFAGVDNTLVRHDGRWWMFNTSAEAPNRDLYVWYSQRLDSGWTAHARNPVKSDVRSSRPAGTPFVEGGILYRPAQDCAGTYGRRVCVNAVRVLTPSRFEEETVAFVAPQRSGPNPDGLHTLSAIGPWTLIDGKCRRFVLSELARTGARAVRKLFGRSGARPHIG